MDATSVYTQSLILRKLSEYGRNFRLYSVTQCNNYPNMDGTSVYTQSLILRKLSEYGRNFRLYSVTQCNNYPNMDGTSVYTQLLIVKIIRIWTELPSKLSYSLWKLSEYGRNFRLYSVTQCKNYTNMDGTSVYTQLLNVKIIRIWTELPSILS